MTASQVSCTTSSPDASVDTWERATRSIIGDQALTILAKALSVPCLAVTGSDCRPHRGSRCGARRVRRAPAAVRRRWSTEASCGIPVTARPSAGPALIAQAALTRPMWLNACGKLPSSSPVAGRPPRRAGRRR